MAKKYLDDTGLARLWDKIKAYVTDAVSGVSDDHKWNDVALKKSSSVGSTTYYHPRMLSTSSTEAYLIASSATPNQNYIARFDASKHMKSEDMSTSDVTSFIDSLSGTPIAPADYVVETGTHNLWKYVKWNSGRIELWGKFEQTVTSYTTNAWVIGHASLTNYPSGITNPIAVATCQKIGTGGGVICYDYERTDYWSGIANNFNGTIAQGESRTISWYVYVNARWK